MSYERIIIGRLMVSTMRHDRGNVSLTFTHPEPYGTTSFNLNPDQWLRFVEFVSTYPATVCESVCGACSAPGPDPCEDCARAVREEAAS